VVSAYHLVYQGLVNLDLNLGQPHVRILPGCRRRHHRNGW
jgi:hypothetical protein